MRFVEEVVQVAQTHEQPSVTVNFLHINAMSLMNELGL